jgi:hypothetical protein
MKRQSQRGATSNCHRWGPPPLPDFVMSHTQSDDEYPNHNGHEILNPWETGSIDPFAPHTQHVAPNVHGASAFGESNLEMARVQPNATFRVSLPTNPSLPGAYHLHHNTLRQPINTARPIYDDPNVTGIAPYEASQNNHLHSGVFEESSLYFAIPRFDLTVVKE